MIKLDTTIKLYTDSFQPYPHKNFSAIIFFDFFWKGEKFISFPVPYSLSPWGLTDNSRDWDEQGELGRKTQYPEVYYYEVKNIQFYITINIFMQAVPVDFHFNRWFIHFLGQEQYFNEEEKLYSWGKYTLNNPSFFLF